MLAEIMHIKSVNNRFKMFQEGDLLVNSDHQSAEVSYSRPIRFSYLTVYIHDNFNI